MIEKIKNAARNATLRVVRTTSEVTVDPVITGGDPLARSLQENGPGPLGDEARRMTLHPSLWIAVFGNLGIVLGIMWNMTQKPGTVESILAVLIGYGIAVAVALFASRSTAKETPPVAETAG